MITEIATAVVVLGGIIALILKRIWGKQILYDEEMKLVEKIKEKEYEREQANYLHRYREFDILDAECAKLYAELRSVRSRIKGYPGNKRPESD